MSDTHPYWIFQANPRSFDVVGAVSAREEMTWLANQHPKRIKPGDGVFIWQSGSEGGILAVAEVLIAPQLLPSDDDEFQIDRAKFEGVRLRVRIRIKEVVSPPLPRILFLDHPLLGLVTFFRGWQGTNFPVTREQADAIDQIIHGNGLGRDNALEFSEGRVAERRHQARERNAQLARAKKQQALERYGRLPCEVCQFDFASAYGTAGHGFMEMHHLIAVSEWPPGERKTRLEDVALVCSNCHRMLHRTKPWPSIADLQNQMRRQRE